MSLESKVTQEFNIKFMDARELVTEARLNLNIHSYPNSDQKQLILDEARRLYHSIPETKKVGMSRDKQTLDAYIIRSSSHSNSVSGVMIPTSTTTTTGAVGAAPGALPTTSTTTSGAASSIIAASLATGCNLSMMGTSSNHYHHDGSHQGNDDEDEFGSCDEDSLFSE